MPEATGEMRRRLRQTQLQYIRAQRQAETLGTQIVRPDEDPSFFWQMMDVLNRPQQALFQLLDGIQEGEDTEPIVSNIWNALEGETERITFGDLLRRSGMQNGRKLAMVGLAGDFLVDPINVVPFGAASKLSKAARIKLLASPKGRHAMQVYDEVLRSKPIGNVRGRIKHWFQMKPDFTPELAQVRELEVLRRLRGLEEAGTVQRIAEEAEAFATPVKIGPKGVQKIGRTPQIKVEPVFEAFEKELTDAEKALFGTQVDELNEALGIVNRMQNSHLTGDLPHWILADALHLSSKSARATQQMMQKGEFDKIGRLVREDFQKLSPKDQRILAQAIEELTIPDQTEMARKIAPLREAADDWGAVERAALKARPVIDELFETERKEGVMTPFLGGIFDKEKARIVQKTVQAAARTKEMTAGEYDRFADLLHKVPWGNKEAATEAVNLAEHLRQVGKGNWDREVVLDALEEMPNLREALLKVKGTKAAPLPRGLHADRFRKAKANNELSAQSAYQVLARDIVDHNVAAKQTRLIAARDKALIRLQELKDKVPGYLAEYMDLETVEHLALDIAKSGTRMRRVMVSAKHRSMIQRKWVDENMRPLSRQEILTILDTEADRLAELGRTKFLRKRRTLWEVARGRPAAMMDYTGMDAASMMALRAQVSARAVGRKQFNEAVGKIFGGYDPTAKDAVRLPGFPAGGVRRGRGVPVLHPLVRRRPESL
jgi:hypothetical protein